MLAASENRNHGAEKGFDVAFLKCSVEPSVFPHELGVFIQGVNRDYESLIDAELIEVDGQTHKGRVEIAIIQRSKEQHALLVELPRQVVMGGRRIWVPESEVEYEHSFTNSDQKTSE